MVSSEQVVKPHSRLAVVKPEVLHLLECQLLVLDSEDDVTSHMCN